MKLRLSETAERDLDQIWNYIATKSGNVDTAKRFVESLLSRLSILARDPKLERHETESTQVCEVSLLVAMSFTTGMRVLSCSFRGSFTGLASKGPPTTKICPMISLTPYSSL